VRTWDTWLRVTGGLLLAMAAPALLALAAIAPDGFELEGGPIACVFRAVTEIDCPFCGMTRATLALGRGDVAGALGHHPLAPAVIVLCVIAGIGVAAGRWPRGPRVALEARHVLACVAVVWIANVIA
jgi:hypothetical protein